MACRMLDTKPLPVPMLVYCQLEQTSNQIRTFHSLKCIGMCHLGIGGYFVQEEMSKSILMFEYKISKI